MALKAPTPTADPRDQPNLDWLVEQLGVGLMPVGAPIPWLSTTIPDGYVELNGAAVPAGCPKLTALFGATLPNLQDKFLGGDGTVVVGATAGANSVTLTSAQSGLPAHGHPIGVGGAGIGTSVANATTRTGTVAAGGGVDNNTAANAAASHENRPAFMAVKWITPRG